jgi:hypothetical protein
MDVSQSRRGGNRMSLSSHISQLRQKHEAIERKIQEAVRSPGSNDLEITALKRQKLQLKEEIARLGGAD